MAHITCSKSGIVFHCEHLPLSLSAREVSHPIFSIQKKKLISLAGQWAAGKLSPTENYLLYLSLLDSTDLIIWRTPASYNSKSPAIIANNMESLIHIIGKIDLISHPSFALPKFAIGPDTADLTNSYYWIQSWISNYNDWYDGYKSAAIKEQLKNKLESRASALEKLIKSFNSDPAKLATVLASWTETAAEFPQFEIYHPLSKKRIPINEYWKEIIRACVNEDKIWSYPQKDISELIEHCEDNLSLEHQGIFSHQVMKILRDGIKKQSDYLGFGDFDLAGKTTKFKIMADDDSSETANIIAIVNSAPESEPKAGNYKTKFEFIKAKMKWDLANRYKKD